MILTIDESLKRLNVPTAKHKLASSLKVVEKFAKSFPVVLKLVSPKVIHKTEAGGVQIVRNSEELKKITKAFLKKTNRESIAVW